MNDKIRAMEQEPKEVVRGIEEDMKRLESARKEWTAQGCYYDAYRYGYTTEPGFPGDIERAERKLTRLENELAQTHDESHARHLMVQVGVGQQYLRNLRVSMEETIEENARRKEDNHKLAVMYGLA